MNAPIRQVGFVHFFAAGAAAVVSSFIVFGDVTQPPDKRDKDDDEIIVLAPFEVSASPSMGYAASATLAGTRMNVGVTPGGLQDLAYARDLLKNGMLPLPGEVTAEGLFSEHDLPVSAAPATRLIEVAGAARRR